MRNILTVCTGNICRSPLAEALLAESLPGAVVTSAGVGAMVGHGPPDEAQDVASANGLDISSHRARQISEGIVAGNDLILVMERGQQRWLADRIPTSVGRTFVFTHWGNGEDVPDPYRRGMAAYEEAMRLIKISSEQWADRLKKML